MVRNFPFFHFCRGCKLSIITFKLSVTKRFYPARNVHKNLKALSNKVPTTPIGTSTTSTNSSNTEVNLLNRSTYVINEIEKYLINNNIKYINKEEKSDIQTFSIENKQYILNDEKIINIIYHIISDTEHFKNIEKKINIKNTILYDIHNIFEKLTEKSSNSIIKSLSSYNIWNFIENTLSNVIAKSFLTEKSQYFGKYRTAFVAQILGKHLLEAFFISIIRNKIIDNSIIERNLCDLENYLKYLKNNSSDYLKIIPYTLDITSKSIIIDYLESHLLITNFKNNANTEHSNNEKYINLERKKIEHEIKLGLILINELIDNKIFTETTNKRKVPFLEFNEKLVIELATTSSFYKPWISTKEPSLIYKTEIGNTQINMNLLYDPIPNKSYVKIFPNPILENIIESINTTPYQINNKEVDAFLNILNELQENADSESTILIIKCLYNIDFHDFLENNNNENLVRNLISFAKDFTCILNNNLREKCSNNLACIYAYNIIIAQKYFIVGLINDLNIYKHFNFFYIPRYVSSTGRTHSMPYYLQLQNNKLTRAFIMFRSTQNISINIEKRNIILSKHLPKIHQYRNEEEYKNNILFLFKQYIISLCKSDADIDTYPYETTNILDQLNWLAKYTKKYKDILYLKTLLNSLKNGTYYYQMYQKDATSNGLQIIGMATGDRSLCEKTNVIGVKPTDIYALALNTLIEDVNHQRQVINSLYNKIFDKSYDNFLNQGFFNSIENLLFQILSDEQFNVMLYKKLELELIQKISFKRTVIEKTIRKLHKYHHNITAFNSLPKDLVTRDLYKKATMAFGYSQGWKSRKQTFLDQIEKYYQKKGYHKLLIDTDLITDLLSRNFLLFANSHLNKVNQFLKITRKYVKGKNITISLKYLKWTMYITSKTISRKRFYKDKEGRKVIVSRFIIHNKKAIADTKVSRTFPAIFVQGIEAHIGYEIINNVNKLNEELKSENLPEIRITSIHDCSIIDTTYADCLTDIVQPSYNSINDLDFPQMGNFGKNKNDKINCTNPYVIKH